MQSYCTHRCVFVNRDWGTQGERMRKGRNRERRSDDSRDREIARYWLIYLQKQRGPNIGSQYTEDPRSQWYGSIQKSTGYIAIKSMVSVLVQRQEEPRIPIQSSQVPGAHSPQSSRQSRPSAAGKNPTHTTVGHLLSSVHQFKCGDPGTPRWCLTTWMKTLGWSHSHRKCTITPGHHNFELKRLCLIASNTDLLLKAKPFSVTGECRLLSLRLVIKRCIQKKKYGWFQSQINHLKVKYTNFIVMAVTVYKNK